MSKQLRIQVVCPAKPGTQHGNRITALRWQRILRQLGHHVAIVEEWRQANCDLLLALHASRSAPSVARFRKVYPERLLIVALTGTDLYRDFGTRAAQASVLAADQLVVLQKEALNELSPALRRKTQVIHQSVAPIQIARPANPRHLRAIVVGHLRTVKDPFRPAMASRSLPTTSRIVVHHYGAALDAKMATFARNEMKRNSRYRWFGEQPRGRVRRELAKAWLLVHPSKVEGGANVVSEALANHIPVLASRIPGSVGLLGTRYSGFFATGNVGQLRDLMDRCEQDATFYKKLGKQIEQRSVIVDPATEQRQWQELLFAIK